MKFIIASLLLLFVLGMAETVQKSKACLSCTSTCVLMAPAGVNFPCYQGAPSDANFCYDTDPLLKPNTTYACGTCAQFGFPVYLQNDPIYKNMELWLTADKKN
uniref:Uncharacterized protein n=1 Tax=Spumella elongata TaxID=89044 RepID=A0A7S3H182_9STRA|mmetsp:Transcript_3/g.9  ORF Transcript_3/g.9 Transcript_3/m.9 type:complete len:103 (+) Transcript_3:34-342(+)|eukprot:CAMPEP_0184967518 /NCGR_PEP_ID=MMETSP1098-20130426/876_1 /TAXON_ID=89044 /ORGANISM="Spumella elongata, Strain CCAP 955/1" /LENGTH=102 /DNA_ID=CAMNT_0027488993 /DNA_START=34 /DNA_END=342 /DNA_ORIENTATION=-